MRKAVINGVGVPLKIVECEIPAPPPEGAVIKAVCAGICHSDLGMIDDEYDFGMGVKIRRRDILGDKFIGMPMGHEISGIVLKLGEKSAAKSQGLAVGDKISVYPWMGCQECPDCHAGLTNTCSSPLSVVSFMGTGIKYDGAFSTHLTVPETRFLVKVPEGVPMDVAAMLSCSATTAYGGIKKASSTISKALDVRGSSNVLIIGAGGLGIWCAKLLKTAFFPENVTVVVADISQAKVAAAKEAGADDVVIWERDMSIQDMVAQVTSSGARRYDAVMNFVGNTSSNQVGILSMMTRGIQVFIGLFGGDITTTPPYMVVTSMQLVGSLTSTLEEFHELVKIVGEKGIGFPNIKYFTLDEVNTALDELKKGKIDGRAIINF